MREINSSYLVIALIEFHKENTILLLNSEGELIKKLSTPPIHPFVNFSVFFLKDSLCLIEKIEGEKDSSKKV